MRPTQNRMGEAAGPRFQKFRSLQRIHATSGGVDSSNTEQGGPLMGFGEAIKSFWANYANFKGRARRSEYWFIALFLFLTNLAAAVIDFVLLGSDIDRFIANGGGGLVGLVWLLATVLPALSVLVRRLHDTGRSGWWVLIGLVPFAGGIVLFIFSVFDTFPGENTYGPSPKLGATE